MNSKILLFLDIYLRFLILWCRQQSPFSLSYHLKFTSQMPYLVVQTANQNEELESDREKDVERQVILEVVEMPGLSR